MEKNNLIFNKETGYKQITVPITIEQSAGSDSIQVKIDNAPVWWLGLDIENKTGEWDENFLFEECLAVLHKACLFHNVPFKPPALPKEASIYESLMKEYKTEHDAKTQEQKIEEC